MKISLQYTLLPGKAAGINIVPLLRATTGKPLNQATVALIPHQSVPAYFAVSSSASFAAVEILI